MSTNGHIEGHRVTAQLNGPMGTWAHGLQRSGSVKTAHPGPDIITFKLTYGRDHHIYTPSLTPSALTLSNLSSVLG